MNSIFAAEFTHPAILSFENGIHPAQANENSVLTLDQSHYKHLKTSLKWEWSKDMASWSVFGPVDYKQKPNSGNGISTFVFWVYSEKPLNAQMKVEFYKQGRLCTYFDYGLNFSGWRAAWIAFDRDMKGKPEEGMDEFRVTVNGVNKGALWFDHLILASMQDSRHHTADLQAPYINANTKSHWLVLLESWNREFDLKLNPNYVTNTKSNNSKYFSVDSVLTKLEERLSNHLTKKKKKLNIDAVQEAYEKLNIQFNPNGSVRGIPIFFDRFGECYIPFNGPHYKSVFGIASLSKFTVFLDQVAQAYVNSSDVEEKLKLETFYINSIRHFLDQGFQAGSAMGTLHHLGYNIQSLYSSVYLMKEPLKRSGLLSEVQKSIEWFAGTGEIKIAPRIPGMDVDAFNTSLLGRLISILLIEDQAQKDRYMRAFKRWIDNGLLFTPGLGPALKPDGSIFHHRINYPAYAVGGLEGATLANYLLSETPYRLDSKARLNLKNSLLAMRFYSNLQTWPLSLSGRHPDGKGHLFPEHYALMALSGSTDYKEKIDPELARAYLRLETNVKSEYLPLFQSFVAETAPQGHVSYPYSSLNVHRRDEWMASVHGFSRYLWNSEIYPGANLYGRYLNYGNLQILGSGKPVSNFGSGYKVDGWDWNRFPGTTATVLPMKELRAKVINPDKYSGVEEMLLSDQAFVGGLSFNSMQGLYSMKLNENTKYGGNLSANKSYFFFNDKIICLGSDINADTKGKEVNTTLYQVNLKDSLNDNFPSFIIHNQENNQLKDGLGNYFFVKDGLVVEKQSLQHSFHEETDEPTQANFATAYINHGPDPKDASYEYMILVQSPIQRLNEIKSSHNNYQVFSNNSMAHIVKDLETGIYGYAFFNAQTVSKELLIHSVNKACLAMHQIVGDELIMSVVDPDLKLYEGNSDLVFDKDGREVERSIYSREWIDNPVGKSIIHVEIKGKWLLSENYDFVEILKSDADKTVVSIVSNPDRRDTNFKLRKN